MATIQQKTGAAPKKGRTGKLRARKSKKASRRRHKGWKAVRWGKRGKKKDTGLKPEVRRSLLLGAVDEIDNVTDLLDASPQFSSLALLVRDIDDDMPPQERDEIARFAKEHFKADIDEIVDQPWQMEIVKQIPEAIAATARWRIERLKRILFGAFKGKEGLKDK